MGMEVSRTVNMKVGDPGSSELKSLGNSNSAHFKYGEPSSSTYEGAVHEK